MADIGAPDVHPGMDALAFQDGLQFPGGGQQLVLPGALAAAQDELVGLVVQLLVGMVRREVAHIIAGAVAVDQVVHIAAKELAGIVDAAEGDGAVEQVRPAQVEVDRMAGAHAGAAGQDLAGMIRAHLPIDLQDAGHQLGGDVVVIPLLHLDARALRAGGVPAFPVDAVAAEDLQPAGLDPGLGDAAHAKVLPVVKAAALAGEDQDGPAGMAEHLELHVAVEIIAVLFVVADLHILTAPFWFVSFCVYGVRFWADAPF